MRHRRAHEPHVHHARRQEVVGEQGLAGDLGHAVDATEGLADKLQVLGLADGALAAEEVWLFGSVMVAALPLHGTEEPKKVSRRLDFFAAAHRAAAQWTASMILL